MAATLAGAFAFAACGGGDSGDAGGDPASDLLADVVVDAVAVEPGDDLASNLLPDLVVDNLNDDNKFGTTFDMLWDESFISWQAIGVSSQPAAVLLTADGTPITGWIGAFPEDEVLRLAAEHPAS